MEKVKTNIERLAECETRIAELERAMGLMLKSMNQINLHVQTVIPEVNAHLEQLIQSRPN